LLIIAQAKPNFCAIIWHYIFTSKRWLPSEDTSIFGFYCRRWALAGWATSGYSVITNANGTNSITITPPMGNLFFRLANP